MFSSMTNSKLYFMIERLPRSWIRSVMSCL
ncbi:hypothetical protein ACHAW6_008186 [Cyclotella cf. meneghiniana]